MLNLFPEYEIIYAPLDGNGVLEFIVKGDNLAVVLRIRFYRSPGNQAEVFYHIAKEKSEPDGFDCCYFGDGHECEFGEESSALANRIWKLPTLGDIWTALQEQYNRRLSDPRVLRLLVDFYKKDTRRFDYLEQNPDVYFTRHSGGVQLLTTDHDFAVDPVFAEGETLRDAIDNVLKTD